MTTATARRGGRLEASLPAAGMIVFQTTSVMTAVALPSMLADFGLGVEWTRWIITAYLLPMAILMAAWGAAGDLFGRWPIYRLGLLIFGLGALLSALASSWPMVLAGQALQATGAAALHPIGTALVAEAAPPERRGRALARLRLLFSLAVMISAPIGGLLVQRAGWHSVYWLGPLVVTILLLLTRRVPAEPARSPAPSFDVVGTLVLLASLGALLGGVLLGPTLGWTAGPVLALLGGALLGLLGLVPIERRQAQPVLPLTLLGQRGYQAMLVAGFLHAIPYFGTYQLAPLLVQVGFAVAPAPAGWLLMVYPIGQALSGLLAGRLADRLGSPRLSLIGLLGTVVGLSLLAAASLGGLGLFLLGGLVTATATGLTLIAMTIYTVTVGGLEQRARASGLYTMITYVGEAIGVSLFPLLLAGHAGAALVDAFGSVYLIAALLAALAIPLTLPMRPSASAPALVVARSGQGESGA